MSPKTKAAVITAAAVAGVVIVVVVVLNSFGGTPIIIKGGSQPDQYVEITGDIPSTGEKDHTAKGEYTRIKVTGASGKCVVYSFSYFKGFKIYLETEPAFEEMYVDDELFSYVGVDFDEPGRFDNPTPGYFRSKVPRMVTRLSIDLPSATCTNSAGPMSVCPTEFPNQPNWPNLEDLYIKISTYEESCP